jgi:peptidoglycan hydrolase CwlO-like protein
MNERDQQEQIDQLKRNIDECNGAIESLKQTISEMESRYGQRVARSLNSRFSPLEHQSN